MFKRPAIVDNLSYSNVPSCPALDRVRWMSRCPVVHAGGRKKSNTDVCRCGLIIHSTSRLDTCAYCAFWGLTACAHSKRRKAYSLWFFILVLLNLPVSMRYDPRNIIIVYIATSASGGQPTNFQPHLSVVVNELLRGAAGFDLDVGGNRTCVHVVAPVFAADSRGLHSPFD